MTVYKGMRREGGTEVTADGAVLDPRHDLRNLSTVLEWGYVGSGPQQLSIALLAHYRSDREALDLYKDFTEAVIAEIQADEWKLDGDAIDRAIENLAPIPMNLEQLLRKVRGL